VNETQGTSGPDGDDERIARPLRALRQFEDGLLALLLTAMILLASLQIFLRNFFDAGIGWADPLVRVLVLWLGLLGALAASRDDRHIDVDVLSRLLPEGARAAFRRVTCLFTAGVAGLVAYHAGRFVLSEFQLESVAFAGVRTWVAASIVPIAFGGIAMRYLLPTLGRARPAPGAGRETP
jgi:TRAP-type C4-dicarboxylate transport system permease small subunit